MKCRRAFETDLLAVLRGEGGDADFLAHYPTCADCAAELHVWRELDAMLRAGTPAAVAHPSEETLLAFVDAPATLATDARAEVERHLATCRTCADEVGSLQHFDPARALAVATPAAAPAPRLWRVAPEPTPGQGWLGRLVWHPAFAYALVAVLLVPLVRGQLERLSVPARLSDAERERRAMPQVAAGKGVDAPAAVGAVARRAQPAPAQEPRTDDGRTRETESDDILMPEEAPAQRAAAAGLDAAEKMRLVEKKAEADQDSRVHVRVVERTPEVAGASGLAEAPDGATALRDLGGVRADTESQGAPHPEAPPVIFVVRSGASTVVPLAVAQRGPLLQITPPPALANRTVDVTVRARAGAHELTQRLTGSANAIALQIPPRWLATGDYTITLAPVASALPADADGAASAPPPVTLGFSVMAPSSASGAR